MSFKGITVSLPAYERLKKAKQPGDSFSDVILREVPDPCETAGQVLDYWEKHPMPKADPILKDKMLAGRGRRSNRKAR